MRAPTEPRQADGVEAVEALRQLGGVGCASEIVRLSSRRKLRTALDNREIARAGRAAVRACRCASASSNGSSPRRRGVPPERGAALGMGGEVATRERLGDGAAQPQGGCSRPGDNRNRLRRPRGGRRRRRPDGQAPHRRRLRPAAAVRRGARGRGLRTPAGDISEAELLRATSALRGRGATQARRVAREADGRAANPFESVLRAIVLEFPGLTVVPQVPVPTSGLTYHPDLVDEQRRIVIEAESWGWHADQQTHSARLRALHTADRGRMARPALHLGAGDALARLRAAGRSPRSSSPTRRRDCNRIGASGVDDAWRQCSRRVRGVGWRTLPTSTAGWRREAPPCCGSPTR